VRIKRLAPVMLLGAAVIGCSSGASAGSASRTTPEPSVTRLTIYGAASLEAALAAVQTAYAAANPDTTLTISTDSSAALETKIEQGAPADVFLSADITNPQKLVDAGLAAGGVVRFAGNRLTVIVPEGNPGNVVTPADLARKGVTVIAAGDAVPITDYATRLVANLAAEPGYPANFAASYDANLTSKEDDVAAVVTKIGLGEGDAAIVYETDARAASNVTTIPVPPDANVAATYGGVVIGSSADKAAAAAFLTWLSGPSGQAILGALGFLPPS
jgi:molybdate transport system substrate-binding protein